MVSILGALTEVTSKATRPSSINIRSPTLQSPGNPKYVVEEIFSSPSIVSVVIVNFAPFVISWEPFLNLPNLIFGPCRSTTMATATSAFNAAWRTISKVFS